MKKAANKTPLEIETAEWNFEDKNLLPEPELEICLLYEYGREHAKHSSQWKKLMQQRKGKSSLKILENIFSLFGKAKIPHFADPKFLNTPWQKRDRDLKRAEAKSYNELLSGPQTFQESICLNITLQRDLPKYEPAGAKDFDSWVLLDRCFNDESNQREYGFFAVNWNYTNGQLEAEFQKWLKEKRGERKPVESEQGQNKNRQHLKALGAKRLLDAGFTVKRAIDYTKNFLKDSHGYPRPLYDSERGWSKAKTETVPAILKRLFPVSK